MARAFAEIDASAISANVRTLASLAPASQLCAVVKADGYGHGATTAASAALDAGATRLGVAQVSEGVALRKWGFDQPIWLFSEPDPAEFDTCVRFQLEPPVYSQRGIAASVSAAKNGPLIVHAMVDTGMHRAGAEPRDAVDLCRRLSQAEGVEVGSVWTHLAVADEPGNPYTDQQLDRFDEVLDQLDTTGVKPPLVHAANSAGIMAVPRAHFDVVRPGVAMYGMAPSAVLESMADLQPALKLWTTISLVKKHREGERISYGLRTTFERDTTVATLPIGYADGVARRWWEHGSVLIHGQRCRIVGVVTMDQMMVDITDVGADGNDVAEGEETVLIGTQGAERISASEWAQALGTINYEITCGIGPRVERTLAT